MRNSSSRSAGESIALAISSMATSVAVEGQVSVNSVYRRLAGGWMQPRVAARIDAALAAWRARHGTPEEYAAKTAAANAEALAQRTASGGAP
jgi:hypothetical protein